MAEKDGSDKLFGETDPFEDRLSMNDKKENGTDIKDSDEEIIELTDPDDAPAAETDEEIIEPADFLDELSEDAPKIAGQDAGSALPSGDDDIIELTDTVEEPSAPAQSFDEAPTSESGFASDDKDLFVFTDSEDEAIIEDDDILSDTVFADEPLQRSDQFVDKEQDMIAEEKEGQAGQDINMFDDTVFANESTENGDEELAVLTEIDEASPQDEKEMFDGTVFSSESIQGEDEELSVLTEPEDNQIDLEPATEDSNVIIEAPSVEENSDMVLFEETESESPSIEPTFIEADTATPSESVPIEIDSASEKDIADSLGMNLESAMDIDNGVTPGDEVDLTIEPEPVPLETGPAPFEDGGTFDSVQMEPPGMDQPGPSVSLEPIDIQPDQLEAAVEKVIRKMFGAKIDSMIIDVIEKAVQTDIEKIKKELLKGTLEDS